MSGLTDDSAYDLDQWLGNHHRVEDKENTNGEEIHVFTIEHGNVYGEGGNGLHYETVFNLGALSIRIVTEPNFNKGTFSTVVYGKYPFLPEFEIVRGAGTFDKGLTLKFNRGIMSGEFRFYAKDQWLWVHYDIKNLGKHWVGDIKMFRILLT